MTKKTDWRKRLVAIAVVISLAALLLTGCSANKPGATEDNAIVIKGSDTEVNMVQALAEAFKAKNPKADISVSGGGSGTGIAALINGEIDIANSSRPMKDEELQQAQANKIQMGTFIVARDGLVVVVHPDNPVSRLTLEQVGAIFRGEIKNWKAVGGPDLPITLYGRQNNSGTYVFFRDVALKGDYSPDMRSLNGNADITNAVAQDKSGIGYIGVGYYKQAAGTVKEVLLSKDGVNYYSALDMQAVDSKLYPLARPLYQFVRLPMKPIVKQFLTFEASAEGQKIVEESGFYPIGEEEKKLNEQLLK
ncbi:phosphate ABC transporter substrate-binding protein PstS family protein [Coprothermobacteraceae bacterium]|nr:phosphate ABC transporter substrate-binding protein PstS family protein [Coprothermobacteraceae bacterium]